VSAPTLPLGHEEYAALAVGWALDALEPTDQDRFTAHRATCRDCEEEAVAALRVAMELAYAVPDLQPPERLRGRLLTAAEEEPPARSRPAPPPRSPGAGPHWPGPARRGGPGRGWHRWHRRLGLLAAAAVVAVSAVVAVLSSVTTWQLTRPQPDRPVPAAAERVAMLSPPVGGGAVVTVVVGPGRADVVTDALPPNAGRGTSYLLWGVPAGDAAPRVVGSFEVTAPGLRSCPVRLVRPADGYPVLAISEERAGTVPAEPGRIIARGALDR
jgi:Anti-sigma-K factor rskA